MVAASEFKWCAENQIKINGVVLCWRAEKNMLLIGSKIVLLSWGRNEKCDHEEKP